MLPSSRFVRAKSDGDSVPAVANGVMPFGPAHAAKTNSYYEHPKRGQTTVRGGVASWRLCLATTMSPLTFSLCFVALTTEKMGQFRSRHPNWIDAGGSLFLCSTYRFREVETGYESGGTLCASQQRVRLSFQICEIFCFP
jgi:hypothetical protein